jgi:hypothetical protein
MTGRIGALAVAGVCVAGVAAADELATLVLTDGGQGRFTRELPAGVPVTIQVPVPEADPTRATLTIYPLRDLDCRDPKAGIQRREYGMSVSGTADARMLQATISPLQIATVYCVDVSYEHGLSAGQLDQLADMVSRTPIGWETTCARLEPDPAYPGQSRHAGRPPAEQVAEVRRTLAEELDRSLVNLRVREPAKPGIHRAFLTQDSARRIQDAAATLTDLLDVPARCLALNARRGDEDRASYEVRRSATRLRPVADALRRLPLEIRSWPAVVMPGPPPVAMPLIAVLGQAASLNAVIEHVQLADPVLAAELVALADAPPAEAPARREALRARLAAPPPHPLPIVVFLPSANRSFRAADLIHPDRIDQSLFDELGHSRELVLHQLGLLRPPDRLTAQAVQGWTTAVSQLADAIAAAKNDEQHYDDAKKARADAEAAIAAQLRLLVQTEVMKALLRKTEIVRDQTPVASRETDDQASWIAPTAGVMVAAPLLLHEGRFADPWLVPYLGASVYFARVDRVIDLKDLVGPDDQLFWQRNSFSVGLLLSRPSLRSQTIAGPWGADIVPFLGFGHRFTQYLRGDVGAIVFQYSDRIPVITNLHWGLAGWIGMSLDADVWAVFSGKLGK